MQVLCADGAEAGGDEAESLSDEFELKDDEPQLTENDELDPAEDNELELAAENNELNSGNDDELESATELGLEVFTREVRSPSSCKASQAAEIEVSHVEVETTLTSASRS